MKDLNDMKYLERVIKETLRLYPVLPTIARTLSEEVRLDGYTLPAGLMVFLPSFLTHRLPEYFPEPERFDPDRFLPENVANRHPYAYIPFSAGPRNCIGQKFALLEVKTVLSFVLRRFKVRAVKEKLTPIVEVTMKPEEGFNLTLSSRNSSF
ncbi:Cytochrome P450 4C1 [Blattella germanica]|nr:Cytochrome P450 4C1 [Blattella germanica]